MTFTQLRAFALVAELGSLRRAAIAAATAGSLTPRAAAAARSEPSSATSANARSWVNVTVRPS